MCTIRSLPHGGGAVSLTETPYRDPPGPRPPSWAELPLWTDSQTGVKTLPSRNFSTEYWSCFHSPTPLIINNHIPHLPPIFQIMDFCPKLRDWRLPISLWEILDPPLFIFSHQVLIERSLTSILFVHQ